MVKKKFYTLPQRLSSLHSVSPNQLFSIILLFLLFLPLYLKNLFTDSWIFSLRQAGIHSSLPCFPTLSTTKNPGNNTAENHRRTMQCGKMAGQLEILRLKEKTVAWHPHPINRTRERGQSDTFQWYRHHQWRLTGSLASIWWPIENVSTLTGPNSPTSHLKSPGPENSSLVLQVAEAKIKWETSAVAPSEESRLELYWKCSDY